MGQAPSEGYSTTQEAKHGAGKGEQPSKAPSRITAFSIAKDLKLKKLRKLEMPKELSSRTTWLLFLLGLNPTPVTKGRTAGLTSIAAVNAALTFFRPLT